MLNVIFAQYDCNKDNLVRVLCLSCLGSVAGLGAASLTSETNGRDVRLKQLVLRFLCAKHITLTMRLVNKVSVPILHLEQDKSHFTQGNSSRWMES